MRQTILPNLIFFLKGKYDQNLIYPINVFAHAYEGLFGRLIQKMQVMPNFRTIEYSRKQRKSVFRR